VVFIILRPGGIRPAPLKLKDWDQLKYCRAFEFYVDLEYNLVNDAENVKSLMALREVNFGF
jgi:hypothetical protein